MRIHCFDVENQRLVMLCAEALMTFLQKHPRVRRTGGERVPVVDGGCFSMLLNHLGVLENIISKSASISSRSNSCFRIRSNGDCFISKKPSKTTSNHGWPCHPQKKNLWSVFDPQTTTGATQQENINSPSRGA